MKDSRILSIYPIEITSHYSSDLSALLLVDTDSTLVSEPAGPEAVDVQVSASSRIVGNNKPVAEDSLEDDIVNGKENSFASESELESKGTRGQGTTKSALHFSYVIWRRPTSDTKPSQ